MLIKIIINPNPAIDIPAFVSSFDTLEELLLIKIHSRTHAAATDGEISLMKREKLMPMGLYRVLQGFPGATISGETSTRGKQPDYVWCPADGNVKMCLTLRVDRENNEIRMESWIRQEDTDNNGRMRICRN